MWKPTCSNSMLVFLPPLSYRCIFILFYLLYFILLFYFSGYTCGIGSSHGRGWIQASAVTYTRAVVLPDNLTHCSQPGIEPRDQAKVSAVTQTSAVSSWTYCTTTETPESLILFPICISQFSIYSKVRHLIQSQLCHLQHMTEANSSSSLLCYSP